MYYVQVWDQREAQIIFPSLTCVSDTKSSEMQILSSGNLLDEIHYKESPVKGKWKWDPRQHFPFDSKSDMQEGVGLPESCGFKVTGDHTKERIEEGSVSAEERPP